MDSGYFFGVWVFNLTLQSELKTRVLSDVLSSQKTRQNQEHKTEKVYVLCEFLPLFVHLSIC